ncbi:MAG: hypothetical protein A2W91_11910 [Bacteroidetes bacterium GWF2_38_335]|nr:MAG: hypothetical protein A2W91_11910 [Bacteroidetes bacterium GWF2_38_335]OFY76879.1 MAG: hypothetical protein A2281_00025 [Bacteroidetes bacterium RIFOXYA12_FULL_38_20]HBS86726.1 hypothetical protein [Bacteroidales bacterium]
MIKKIELALKNNQSTKAYFLAKDSLNSEETKALKYYFQAESLYNFSLKLNCPEYFPMRHYSLEYYKKSIQSDSLFYKPYIRIGDYIYYTTENFFDDSNEFLDKIIERKRMAIENYYEKALLLNPNDSLLRKKIIMLKEEIKQ